MKNTGWNPPSHRSGATRIEDGKWQGRAGTPLPAAVTSLVGRRCRAAGVGAPTPYRCRHFIALFCFCLLPFAFCLRASGQSYSINWHKIAGGGGTSTNGQYTVSGTIGQHDAGGPMIGGNYSLTGGFWALISVVQTPGAPTLYISHTGNTVTVYWQAVAGWTNLEQNSSLSVPVGWTTNTDWTTANGTNSLNLTSPSGNLFFRLKH